VKCNNRTWNWSISTSYTCGRGRPRPGQHNADTKTGAPRSAHRPEPEEASFSSLNRIRLVRKTEKGLRLTFLAGKSTNLVEVEVKYSEKKEPKAPKPDIYT
jgi:hypothetical protein